ncbi:MAG: 4Fe-4S dicluster domain-containing protein [Elusimicrobia bacterium]|jgi:Na+-translocating ferredoxin:NAD+ oxidoreductase RnfC subunit|nr:4Fe-4S dicluster domain-containing protein [Elusimicrobiota bacterium]
MERKEILKKIKAAGVVGAGGAGFPSHMKISADVDTVIANGAECEPLLSTDRYLMETKAEEIAGGLRFIGRTTGAGNLYIALKKKYKKAVDAFNSVLGSTSDIELILLDNYYPAGDEFELVYDIAGRLIPEGGIPLDVGAVVTNVNTILNIYIAVEKDKPVTTRWITVAGDLKEPFLADVPVGIKISELIKKAKPNSEDYKIVAGGPMTGEIVDGNFRVTKLGGGVLVLPEDSPVIIKKERTAESWEKKAKSTCDQCFDCSIICPRNLLGHDLEPHKIMRNLFIAPENLPVHLTNSFLCSSCGLCDMYACPMDLSPRALLAQTSAELTEKGIKSPHNRIDLEEHPERNYRRVSTDRLTARLDIDKYEMHENYKVKTIKAADVLISLKQHIGVSAVPAVKKGDNVKKGDIIAEVPGNQLGANIHSSIDGAVSAVTKENIEIKG